MNRRFKFNKSSVLILLLITMLIFVGCSEDINKQAENDNVEEGQIQTVDTGKLQENIDKEDWVVVDTRIIDAFNGWKIDNVKRGGHIKGATDLSVQWLKVDDSTNLLQNILVEKGITPDKNIVLYDANGQDAEEVAQFLIKNGFTNIYKYDVNEWADDESLPMESYSNYHMIVPATWVNDLINGKNPETYNGKSYKIFEVSWGEEAADYKEGHIPGAVHINTDEVEEGPVLNRLSDEGLEKFALNNGINVDTTVVLYGADLMPAYRVAAILKYMGVKDIRVLNGGYNVWIQANYDVETTVNKKVPIDSFGAEVPANGDYIIDLPEVKEILADKNGSKLVDIRSWKEHNEGRPAGAVWGCDINDFRNIDNTMRNAEEILEMWKERGITPEQKLSFFCRSGWRAAEMLIYSDIMGIENISLYDGSWDEWSADSSNPIEVGEPTVFSRILPGD